MTKILIRFDDLCPTMNWAVWDQIEPILVDLGVQPLVAVIPDNHDPTLKIEPARPDFWERVRQWQSLGWSIGLHGYQHRYVTKDAGIVGVNQFSEFAGLPEQEQEQKLRAALEIFRRERVTPDVWVAPGHSFDAATLRVLGRLGIRTVSDGFYFRPTLDEGGMTWVPQQLWRFRRLPFGVWTVCIHHNVWTDSDIQRFRLEVALHRRKIVGLGEVLCAGRIGRRTSLDQLMRGLYWTAFQFKRLLRPTVSAGRGG